MRRTFLPVDIVIAAYFAIMTTVVVVFWGRIERPLFYVALHALVVGLVALAAVAHRRFDRPFWRLVHYWMIAVVVLASFREIHFLVPEVHPFRDRAYDLALRAHDVRYFGDVDGFFRSIAHPLAADILSLCYWTYFPMPILLGVAVYRRGDLAAFRETATVLFVGWYLSYFGYFLVPAVGPHLVVEGARAPELSGWLWADALHRLLLTLELETPDAFPSGHTLVTILTLLLAWRHARRVFWTILPFSSGLVLATMYLRYHYVVDVVAGVLLVPVSLALGSWIDRAWTKAKA